MGPKESPKEEREEQGPEEEEEKEEEAEEEAEEETPPTAVVKKKIVPGSRRLLDAADELRGVAKDLRADMQAMKKGGILGKLVGGKGTGEGSGSEDPATGGSGGKGAAKKGEGFVDGLRSLFGLDD